MSSDVEPAKAKARRTGRLTAPQPDSVSAAEFEEMKRELGIEEEAATRHTSTLSKRLAHTEEEAPPAAPPAPRRTATPPKPAPPKAAPTDGAQGDGEFTPAPDVPENEGVAPIPKSERRQPKSRSRNRRHGRRR